MLAGRCFAGRHRATGGHKGAAIPTRGSRARSCTTEGWVPDIELRMRAARARELRMTATDGESETQNPHGGCTLNPCGLGALHSLRPKAAVGER